VARPTLARIDAQAIRANGELARALAPRARMLACVKADAYGHGIETTARALAGVADGFAVACIEEALVLRGIGIAQPVLMLEGPHTQVEVDEAFNAGFILCLSSTRQLDWLEQAPADRRPDCWIKIDTGMHRLGFDPASTAEVSAKVQTLLQRPVVLCTHFASADRANRSVTEGQLAVFDTATSGIDAQHSCANSAAIFAYPQSHRDWIRPGYMLYGGNPLEQASAGTNALKPAMELSAEVIAIRDVPAGDTVGYGGRWCARRPSRIATIAAGYGDGYPRQAPDGTPVRIGAHRSPLAGRVSMDMITVDVTDNPDAAVGARAILWGSDPRVDEVARHAETIGYELLAGMPKRVPRITAAPS
jgi:alanine racemase